MADALRGLLYLPVAVGMIDHNGITASASGSGLFPECRLLSWWSCPLLLSWGWPWSIQRVSIIGWHAFLAPPKAPQLVQKGGSVFEQKALQLRNTKRIESTSERGGYVVVFGQTLARGPVGQHRNECHFVCVLSFKI